MAELWAALYMIAEWEKIPVEELYSLVTGLAGSQKPEKAMARFVMNYGRKLRESRGGTGKPGRIDTKQSSFIGQKPLR